MKNGRRLTTEDFLEFPVNFGPARIQGEDFEQSANISENVENVTIYEQKTIIGKDGIGMLVKKVED
jgi:hypothetical protein